MEVRDASVLSFVDERRSSDVIPHLTGHHGECEEKREQTPELFVLQEFQVVALEVEESSDECDKHNHCNGSRVVWWTENANLDVSALLHPLSDGLSGDSNALDVHGVAVLLLSLRWEVHENRCSVESEHLENVRALVKVHHGEEELVRVDRRVAVRVGEDGVLVRCWPANHTLPRWLKCREHNNNRVIAGSRLDVFLEFVSIQAENRLLRVPIEELLDLLAQRSRALQRITEKIGQLSPKATSSVEMLTLCFR
jgi:hypothetical protein